MNAADHAALETLLARGLHEKEILRRFEAIRPDVDPALVETEIEALGGADPRTLARDLRPAMADFSLLITADPPKEHISRESALLVQDFSGIEDLRAGLSALDWTDGEIAEVVVYCEHVRFAKTFFANPWQHDAAIARIETTRGRAVDRGWPHSSAEIAAVVHRIGWRFYEGPLTALNERLDSTAFAVEFAHWGGDDSATRTLFIGDGSTPSRFGDPEDKQGSAS